MYLDGSVLLSHGGVEMGQGLHTKMLQVTPTITSSLQVASRVLEVPMARIHIVDTSTDTVGNA